jgi:hypothetical protein
MPVIPRHSQADFRGALNGAGAAKKLATGVPGGRIGLPTNDATDTQDPSPATTVSKLDEALEVVGTLKTSCSGA